MSTPAYSIVLSEQTLAALTAYKADIAAGKAQPGDRLKSKLTSGMTTEQFLEALLATKSPRLFAESEIRADGTDWNHRELALLGDINVSMPVEIFDNGVWAPSHTDFREHTPPLAGHLLFTPGVLLNTGEHFKGQSPDMVAVTTDGKIDQEKYNALVERRMLPLFADINDTAKKTGKPALVTLPGIGCGAFAGKFRGEMGAHLNTALQALFKKHAKALSQIKMVYFDTFNECGNETRTFGTLQYRVRPAMKNPSHPQLATPATYEEWGDNFSNCTLYKIVAWDHASLPGNDFYANKRETDDGVSAAATNSMQVITGWMGRYYKGKYHPLGYSTWEQVAQEKGTHLLARGNVKVVSAEGQSRPLTQQAKPTLRPSPFNPRP